MAKTEYTADVELFSGCLRVLSAGATVDVDPYSMAASAHWLDRRTVELKGTTSDGTTDFASMRSAVCEVFAGLGVETVIWTRKRIGRPDGIVMLDTKTHRVKR